MYLVCAVAHGQAHIASPRMHLGSNIVSDSHPFHSKSTDPPIAAIWLFENLTLKIQVQGHGQGTSSRSRSKSNNLSTHPFRSMSNGPPILGIHLFHNLTLNVQSQDHSSRSHSGSTSYWLTTLLFHVNRPAHSWNTAFSRSWDGSKFKATKCVPLPIHSHPFRSMLLGPLIPVIWLFQHLILKIQGQGDKPMMLHNYRFRTIP